MAQMNLSTEKKLMDLESRLVVPKHEGEGPSAAASFVSLPTSGVTNSHGVTGGVYKARERIHRSMLICDY